jgi:hypothetical protein
VTGAALGDLTRAAAATVADDPPDDLGVHLALCRLRDTVADAERRSETERMRCVQRQGKDSLAIRRRGKGSS